MRPVLAPPADAPRRTARRPRRRARPPAWRAGIDLLGGHVDVLAQPRPGPLESAMIVAAGADGGAEVEGLGDD